MPAIRSLRFIGSPNFGLVGKSHLIREPDAQLLKYRQSYPVAGGFFGNIKLFEHRDMMYANSLESPLAL